MVIRQGKAKEIIIAIGLLEPISLPDVNVELHDNGVVEIKGMDLDPKLEITCHISCCEISWDFTEIGVEITPSPQGNGSVTQFRPRKKK